MTRVSPGTTLGLIAVVVATAGVAVAANPSSDGKITACVNKKSKGLRLASSAGSCHRSESKLSWNVKGERGPAGEKGAAGAAGAAGTPGTPGTPGTNGTNGTPGVDASVSSRSTASGEATTSSTTPVALTGGPSVTVTVPEGGALVILGAGYDAKNATPPNGSCANYFDGATAVTGAGCGNSGSYARVHNAAITEADAGSHTYSLEFYSPSGTLASFQNRTLIVSVLK